MSEEARSDATGTERVQAGVVPFRQNESGTEFCLITARRSGRWAFPKGCVREHESIESAALSEALEEAGITGHTVGEPLGNYEYSKRGDRFTVSVLLMQVRHCSQFWKEGTQRDRRWVTFEQALELLDRPNLVALLHAAHQRLAGTETAAPDETPIRA